MLDQAVILCGGLGTRLGALTSDTPKPMLPVAGRPFIEILIQEAARFGYSDILLLAGRFGRQVADRYHDRTLFGSRIRVCIEPNPCGTGGALRYAQASLAAEFLLMNGDSWIDTDLRQFAGAWEMAKRVTPGVMVQMLLQKVANPGRFGTVETDRHLVTAFREKDTTSSDGPAAINAGVYILKRDLMDSITDGVAVSLETDVLPAAVADGKVAAVRAPEESYFVDIGVPESYSRAQIELPSLRCRPAVFFDRDGTLNADLGYTHLVSDLEWMPGAREAVALANACGFYVFVVTNQAGVAKGRFSEDDILAFHSAMQRDLSEVGAHIDAIEWCPHHIEATEVRYRKDCPRRKPGGGMLADLIAAWPVDVQRSILIGDAETDLAAAKSVGVRGLRYNGGSLLALLQTALEG